MREQKLTNDQYKKVQEEKNQLPEWKAICKVLNISESINFISRSAGTSSSPEEGLIITFLD